MLIGDISVWPRYLQLKDRFQAVYQQRSRSHVSEHDAEVMSQLSWKPELDCDVESEDDVEDVCSDELPVLPLWQTVEMDIRHVRFAHNDNSELYRLEGDTRPSNTERPSAERRRSILQTSVELLSGLISTEVLPVFKVCKHEGRVYARTGNRRLAAFRLAAMIEPQRFQRIHVRPGPVDEAFLHHREGHSPKLTTHLNGQGCCGRWMRIRETNEVVGRRPARNTYGRDLLELLFRLE